MSKHTGGPAFPVEKRWAVPNERFEGMTLRDYIAAKAMQGQLCAQANSDFGIWKDFEALAEEAYRISDAMIGEREK